MSAFVNDTFTDANGTLIAAHVGETGATWTRDYTFSDVNWHVESNRLQLADFAGSLSDHRIRASGVSPTGNCYVEIGLVCSGATFFEFELLARGNGSDDVRGFFQVGAGGTNELQINYTGAGTGGATLTPGSPLSVADGTHIARMELQGSTVTLLWDGVQVLQATNMASLTSAGVTGMAMQMISDDIAAVGVDYFIADSLAPTGPFWTDYVKTTEMTA